VRPPTKRFFHVTTSSSSGFPPVVFPLEKVHIGRLKGTIFFLRHFFLSLFSAGVHRAAFFHSSSGVSFFFPPSDNTFSFGDSYADHLPFTSLFNSRMYPPDRIRLKSLFRLTPSPDVVRYNSLRCFTVSTGSRPLSPVPLAGLLSAFFFLRK